jgi:PAS domain S-box-containing protein
METFPSFNRRGPSTPAILTLREKSLGEQMRMSGIINQTVWWAKVLALAVALLLCNLAHAEPSGEQRLRIGVRADYYPFEFVDKSGEPNGFSVELFQAVAREMNLSYSFSIERMRELWNLTSEGRINVLLSVPRGLEQQRNLLLGIEHSEDTSALFVRKGVPIPSSLEEAADLSMLVVHSGSAEQILAEHHFSTPLVRVETIKEGLELLGKGKYDALMTSKLVGTLQLQELNISNVVAGPSLPNSRRSLAFAVKENDGALVQRLNQGLAIIRATGEYQTIYDKWFGPHLPWWQSTHTLLIALLVAIGIILVWSGWVVTLRIAVNRRSRELTAHKANLERMVETRTSDLMRSEIRFRSYFEQATIGICVTAPNRRFREANHRASEIFGYTHEELLKKTWVEITHTDDLVEEERLLTNIAAGFDTSYVLEKRFLRSDGTYLWCSTEVRAVKKEDGSTDYMLKLVQDISERKQADEALREATKTAELANQAKSQFLANMSHELRTPMNGIFGMADLLGTTNLNADQRKFLDIIVSSSDRLLSVINDILDLSRVESGKMELIPARFNLRELMFEKQEIYRAVALRKNVAFNLSIPVDLPETVIGDAHRIDQVLCNLLNNAVKFTESGTISLAASIRELDGERLKLRFSVSDTGIGIPAEKMGMLFSYFGQLDMSLTKKYGGTGLGLAISKALAQQMGGDCFAESVTGRGSTFHFDLTLALPTGERPPVSEPPQQSSAEGSPNPSARLLLVEDDLVSQLVIAEFCKQQGFQLKTTSSAHEALEALAECPFDLILMDIQLPDVSGIELATTVRERFGDAMPIIATTAYSQKSQEEALRKIRLDGFFQKPYNLQALLNLIIDVLDKKSPF